MFFLFIFMFSQRCCNLHWCNLRIRKAILQTALYTSFFYFQNYSSVFRENLISKGLFHVTGIGTIILHYLKGLLAPLFISSRRYQFPFCSMQKGISYRMQNRKNPRMKSSILCTISVLFEKPNVCSTSITEACLLMPAHPLIPSSPDKVCAKEILQ